MHTYIMSPCTVFFKGGSFTTRWINGGNSVRTNGAVVSLISIQLLRLMGVIIST